MDKTYDHKRNIISEKSENKNKIVPGSIVRFSYGGKKVTDSKPLVLVLHPRFRGKLHGLNIGYIPESVLQGLWKLVQETVQGKVQRLIKLRLPLLKADIGNPKQFYWSRLRGFLRSKMGSTAECYRTYNTSSIGGVRLVDYRFKDSEWERKKLKGPSKKDLKRG